MNDSKQIKRVFWTDEEWDLIATELKRHYPIRATHTYMAFNFTLDEFEDAMEAVIQQEHHKSFDDFSDVKRPLYDAFMRQFGTDDTIKISNKHRPKVPVDAGGRIWWTDDEWVEVVLAISRLTPYAFENRLVGLSLSIIRDAIAVLPGSRHRIIKNIPPFRDKALEVWDSIAVKMKRAPVVVEFKSGPVAEPEKRKRDDSSAIATAMHEAFQAPVKPSEPKKKYKQRVTWTDAEWLAIATEMYRQNPHANWFTSSFSVIDLAAVRDAQRQAMPFERRRTIAGQAHLQEPLVAAFKELKRIHNEEIEVKPITATLTETQAVMQRVEKPEIKAVERVVSVVSTDLAARLAQAATPLISTIMEEFAAHLMPELLKALTPMLTSALNDIKQAVKPVIVTHQQSPTYGPIKSAPPVNDDVVEVHLAAPVEKPKKARIAILGPLGNQKAELERAFPEYRLSFIENGHGIKEAGASAELFIASNKHLAGANKDAIKHYIPKDKLRYVDGGTTSIKHQINVWKAQNDAAK